MFNYIAFLHSGLEKAGETATEDGKALANQCLSKFREIDNPEQFPPKLLFLLASASYLGGDERLDESRARELIGSIHRSFADEGYRDIQLIGSTVAAVFFDNDIYPEGVVLACLASRLLDVNVAVGTNVSFSAEEAVKNLLERLNLDHTLEHYPRPLPNRALLTFFPGTGGAGPAARHSTDKLHALLLDRLTYRIPIVGGVSSANDTSRGRRGLQFVNRQTFTDALAGCLIFSGVPLGTSLAKGLQPIGEIVHVQEISKDGTRIEQFYEGKPQEIFQHIRDKFFNGEPKPILLKDLSPSGDFVRAKCLPNEYDSVEVLREVRKHAALEVATPTPEIMYAETKSAHRLSLDRANITQPVGCLSFKCSGHLAYSDSLKLNLQSGIEAMKKKFNIPVYIGGFFDGEAGTDEGGGSVCRGWSVGTLIFGDQMSERTAVEAGFDSLAKHGAKLAGTFNLAEDLEQSLELISDLGFPGAMISILMPDRDRAPFVPMKSTGSRCERLMGLIQQNGNHDYLEQISEPKSSVFMSDSSKSHSPIRKLILQAGIKSQYVRPLMDPDGEVMAILRVELGDARGSERINSASAKVLEPVGAIVGAAINRIFTWEENQIVRKLDKALQESLTSDDLPAAFHNFLKRVLITFELEMGHVRIFDSATRKFRLETGFGKYYDTASQHRSEPDIGDWSPSHEALTEYTVTIVNDSRNDNVHQAMRARYSHNVEMSEALDYVGSYANVPFKNQRGDKKGTVSLIAEQPWYFTRYHLRALTALRRRLNFLVDHFTRKQREAEAHKETEDLTRRLQFLLDVSPELYKITNFGEVDKILRQATRNVGKAIGAEHSSLYIWNERLSQYILRAEDGWRAKDWVGAARYAKDSQWIGSCLGDTPLFIEDLYKYYVAKNYEEPRGRYAKQIFGFELSENFSAEAIAVPLWIGRERLGALTFYRPINPQAPPTASGFAIRDSGLLMQAGSQIAGLVKLLQSLQVIRFDRRAQERHQEVLVAAANSEGQNFEVGVCERVLKIFGASKVDFFRLDEPFSEGAIVWQHGARKDPGGSVHKSARRRLDERIKRCVGTNSLEIVSKALSAKERRDPNVAVTEGSIEEVCIPLLAAGTLVGALDLRWNTLLEEDHSLGGKEGEKHLREIGQALGSAYWRNSLTLKQKQAEQEAEQNRLAVQAVGAMVFQTAHRFGNLVQTMYDVFDEIQEARDDDSRRPYMEEMSNVINETMRDIKWPMDIAKRIQNPTRERHSLRRLMEQSLSKAGPIRDSIHLSLGISRETQVMIEPELTKQAFFNLIRNALQAMNERESGELRILASEDGNRKRITVVIEDTGVGMTAEEVDSAERGFVTKGRHTGVGVLISSVLLHVQRGTLWFRSKKGSGTLTFVTLPTE